MTTPKRVIQHYQLKLWVAPYKNCAADCMDLSSGSNSEKEVRCYHNCIIREKEISRIISQLSKQIGMTYS